VFFLFLYFFLLYYYDLGSWQLKENKKSGGLVSNFDSTHIEIIGNIYDNKELLEEK